MAVNFAKTCLLRMEINLTETQHKFNKNIIASMHAHLSHEDYIEVLITRGDVSGIKKLADAISSTRWVRNCKTAVLG